MGSFDNLSFQSGANVISKKGRDNYLTVGQFFYKVGQLFQNWGKNYFNMGQLFQREANCCFNLKETVIKSGAVISKWGITLSSHLIYVYQENYSSII